MCHGDITPIAFEWISSTSGYIVHRTTKHQCRNFDAIYEWAQRRDATGLSSDGNVTVVYKTPAGSYWRWVEWPGSRRDGAVWGVR
ncbi:hypothetical protein BJ878DRAFT_504210 [Calycina marina]|uniref:Uncharacterized protein n=1 Tax=Calycina marina TaxID=1763456 RepID=A0A9P7Z3U3_9HELO|nr:hypothetical protein BJ878DRAFT_504210 [Calycina marina]